MTSAQSVSQPQRGVPPATSRQELPAWQALERHADEMHGVTLRALFDQDPDRARDLAFETCGLYVDLSKHQITRTTLRLLLELAEQCRVTQRRDAMFAGEKINVSEHRAVLHMALRAPRDA
jgi:glucose-6-phosphate isomerase